MDLVIFFTIFAMLNIFLQSPTLRACEQKVLLFFRYSFLQLKVLQLQLCSHLQFLVEFRITSESAVIPCAKVQLLSENYLSPPGLGHEFQMISSTASIFGSALTDLLC